MADSPAKNTDGPLGLHVKLGGAPMDDTVQVLRVQTQCGVGRIPEATMVIVAGSIAEAEFPEADGTEFSVGNDIKIAASYGDGKEQVIFEGIIVAKRMRANVPQGSRVELRARDKAIALTRARKSTLYEKKKDSDVMSAVISDAGLQGDIAVTTGSSVDQLRYGCSDWDFLRHVSERNGHILTVDAGKLKSEPPATSAEAVLTATLGADILDLDVGEDSQDLIVEAEGQAWNAQSQKVLSGKGKGLPKETWGDKASKKMATATSERKQVFATARELEAAELTTLANARELRSALSAMQGTCKYNGNASAKPGDILELKGVGKRFGGKAFISGIAHKIDEGVWETTATLGLPLNWTADNPNFSNPGAEGLATPIHGVQIGIVLGLTEDPDGKLRIKLKLPMIGDPASEVWARYAQPYASVDAGIQFMPETNDEVLVAFLNADPNAPVVIGSVHNKTAKRPNETTEENELKVIKTKSGLKIEFNDDKKIITLETPGGHSVVMDDDAKEIALTDLNGNSIVMSASGIEIKSDKDITVKAGGAVDISATSDATVAGANVTCEGQSGFTGKGGAQAELSGGGKATISGGMVMIN